MCKISIAFMYDYFYWMQFKFISLFDSDNEIHVLLLLDLIGIMIWSIIGTIVLKGQGTTTPWLKRLAFQGMCLTKKASYRL